MYIVHDIQVSAKHAFQDILFQLLMSTVIHKNLFPGAGAAVWNISCSTWKTSCSKFFIMKRCVFFTKLNLPHSQPLSYTWYLVVRQHTLCKCFSTPTDVVLPMYCIKCSVSVACYSQAALFWWLSLLISFMIMGFVLLYIINIL